jgi:tetratricopeptide (TPR) repeat protein
VRVVAAAGTGVDYPLLAAVCELAEPELAGALREAVAAQVLVPRGAGYELRHALLREAAYGELLPGERERLHAALAAELETRAGDAPRYAELAHHWHAAGEPDRLLTASVRAGDEAAAVHAHPEALRHLQRGLELWERASPAARAGLDRAAIASAAACAAGASGEHGVAVALAEQAVGLVDAAAEPVRAGVLQARLAHNLQDGGRGDEARLASERAVALLPPDPTPERARVLESHARLLLLGARIEPARAPVDEAIAIARALGLRDVEAAALTTNVISLHGRATEAVAAGEEALRPARDAGDPETLMRAHANASEALEQAAERLAPAHRTATELGARPLVAELEGARRCSR